MTINYASVEVGHAEIVGSISPEQHMTLKAALKSMGLELIDDIKGILIQRIKSAIIEVVHYQEEPLHINLSDFLSQKLNHNYTYLANVFSDVQGITIEEFVINHKIERVKELLVYDELNL